MRTQGLGGRGGKEVVRDQGSGEEERVRTQGSGRWEEVREETGTGREGRLGGGRKDPEVQGRVGWGWGRGGSGVGRVEGGG